MILTAAPMKRDQRRVVDAENGILEPLVALEIAHYNAVFPCRVTVDAQRVGLVLVMIDEIPDDPRRSLLAVLAVRKHVLLRPLSCESAGSFSAFSHCSISAGPCCCGIGSHAPFVTKPHVWGWYSHSRHSQVAMTVNV